MQVKPSAAEDAAPIELGAPDGADADSSPIDVRPIVLALLAVAAVWIVLFVLRVQAHQPNTDDFLYARVSMNLIHAANPLSAILTTGQTSPLVPTLAAPLVTVWGVEGGVALNLPILLALCLGAYTLSRVWVDERTSLIMLLVTGLNAAVLSYALMYNFALASSAAMVWCLATYLRSDRLHRWGWSIGFAFSFAALILSRSVAPVYAVPLAALVVVDLAWGLFKRGHRITLTLPAVLGIILVVAGPWWIRSGRTVAHYLVHAGYQPSSGYTHSGLVLTPASVWNRVTFELLNLDWIGGVLLGVAVAAAIVAWWFSLRNHYRLPGLWILWAWTVIALLILSSSGNAGTAFGLPLITVVIIGCGAVLGRAVTRHRVLIAGSVLAVTAVTTASLFSNAQSPWWHAAPYRTDVIGVGAAPQTNLDTLARSIDEMVRGQKTVMGVQNSLVNTNAVLWSAGSERLRTHIGWLATPLGENATAGALKDLKSARWLITGGSTYSFVPLNQSSIQLAAFRRGFRPVRIWDLGPYANVVLWRKGAKPVVPPGAKPVVKLAKPTNGSTVSGDVILVCGAHDPFGIAGVDYEVSGGPAASRQSLPAAATYFGWLGIWAAQKALPGRYTITCNVTNFYGVTGHASVSVNVR
jgi:hypothetical protein